MGWPPSVVAETSLWRFRAAAVGWAEANGAHRDLDPDEMSDLSAALDAAV